MGLINAILNLAGLLLWLAWRDRAINPLVENPAAPLARTLRRAAPDDWRRWEYPSALGGLLLLRAIIYWWIGPAVNAKPLYLQLAAIAIPFRCNLFGQMVLFSVASFAGTLVFFHLSLLLLSLVNRDVTDAEPLQKFVRGHLGFVARLPFVAKLFLPVLAAVLFWVAASPLLAWIGILPRTASMGALFKQGLLIGVGACLVWKYVMAAALSLYFLNSYVYFGRHPLWSFASQTSRRLLAPLRWLPLKLGRMDFAPVAGIVLIFLAATLVEKGFKPDWLQNSLKVLSLVDRYEATAR